MTPADTSLKVLSANRDSELPTKPALWPGNVLIALENLWVDVKQWAEKGEKEKGGCRQWKCRRCMDRVCLQPPKSPASVLMKRMEVDPDLDVVLFSAVLWGHRAWLPVLTAFMSMPLV